MGANLEHKLSLVHLFEAVMKGAWQHGLKLLTAAMPMAAVRLDDHRVTINSFVPAAGIVRTGKERNLLLGLCSL